MVNNFLLASISLFSWHKLTPHVFCKTSSGQARNLTSILLNSVSGSKRGRKGTFPDLYQYHPKNKCKKYFDITRLLILSN